MLHKKGQKFLSRFVQTGIKWIEAHRGFLMPQISFSKHSVIEKYHFQKNIVVFKDDH